jgi:signal transduction histidine kinase
MQMLFRPEFASHGYAYYWRPGLIWLHAITAGLLAASCYFIFLALLYVVRKRSKGQHATSPFIELRFGWLFMIFGIFILGSGTTQLIEIWTVWHGTYGLVGLFKALTAIASVATSIALVVMVPKAIAAPSHSQLNELIAVKTTQIEALSAYHVSRIEDERRRISRELHDDLGQSLIAVKLLLHNLARRLDEDAPELRDELEGLRRQVNLAVGQVTDLDRRLRPPILGPLGLDRAIEGLCADQHKRHGLTVRLDLKSPLPRLPESAEIAIYRIAQEGLANVAKHANATQIWLRLLWTNDGVEFNLRDDGEGFDPEAEHKGLGLAGMKDRATMLRATFCLAAKRNEGTTISLNVPLEVNTVSEEPSGIITREWIMVRNCPKCNSADEKVSSEVLRSA